MITENKQTQLDIIYDGPAVADGSMNVKDLAPAMLSIGTLFEAANNITNGQLATINIKVRATSSGSFHILYEVIQASQAIDPNLLATAVQIRDWLIGGVAIGGGVFGLIKWARARKPKLTKVNEDLYTLTIDDETYEIPLVLLRLYQDASIRRSIADMVRPVKEEGIDSFQVRGDNLLLQEVKKEEVEFFDIPGTQDLLLDETRRQAFSITTLSFKEDNKWRLTDGQNIFSVSMKDAAFQRRVDNNQISFAKGDVLLCDLRTIQWQVQSGVKTEYEVVKVVSHTPARQLSLFQNDDNLTLS
jgi:hypothetical protein